MDSDKLVFAIIGGITVVVLAIILLTSFRSTSSVETESVLGNAPIYKGVNPTEAKLVFVEFSDFECPFCAQYPPLLNEVVRLYPDQVAVVYRHFPLPSHSRAIPTARAAEAANLQGKFWEYHDELFANQGNFTDEDLESYAQIVGLDVEKFKQDYTSEEVAKLVSEDADFSRKLNLRGTPSFYLVYDGKTEPLNITNGPQDLIDTARRILGENAVEQSDSENSENIEADAQLENSENQSTDANIPENMQGVVASIKAEIAENSQNQVAAAQISVVSVEEMQWNDSALGCPAEGKMYMQVITPGYKIVLTDGVNQYEYHTDMNGNYTTC